MSIDMWEKALRRIWESDEKLQEMFPTFEEFLIYSLINTRVERYTEN